MTQLSPRVQHLVQPHLTQLDVYDPSFTPTRINLSANENTYDVPPRTRTAINEVLIATPTNRYPDPLSTKLRDELASWRHVSCDEIVVGNGGDELLYNVLLAFGGPQSSLVICPPTFAEYAFFAALTKTPLTAVARDKTTLLPDSEALVRAASQARLVVLTSPNNPTGDCASPELIERLCDTCPGLVLVDAAYSEFVQNDEPLETLLATHDNLLILHTLSKAFALAGARCGYLIAAPDIIEVLVSVRQLYSVNVLTQAAACVAVQARQDFEPTVAQIIAERTRLYDALTNLCAHSTGTVWPSEGNFLLICVAGASRIRTRLRNEYSILVRDVSATPGLADCLRITIGTPEENDCVLRALATLIEEESHE